MNIVEDDPELFKEIEQREAFVTLSGVFSVFTFSFLTFVFLIDIVAPYFWYPVPFIDPQWDGILVGSILLLAISLFFNYRYGSFAIGVVSEKFSVFSVWGVIGVLFGTAAAIAIYFVVVVLLPIIADLITRLYYLSFYLI